MGKQNRKQRASTRIKSIRSKLNVGDTRNKLQTFLTEYFLCEMACKEMIVGYQDSINKPVDYKNVKMHFKTIVNTMNYYGINIDNTERTQLFSSDINSAKSIRDSIVHGITKDNIDKLNNHYTKLMADMRHFIEEIER